jgi:PAS domain S-box-containing protein
MVLARMQTHSSPHSDDAVFRALPDPAFLLRPDGTVLALNDAAAAQAADLVGRAVQDSRLAHAGGEAAGALAAALRAHRALTLTCSGERDGRLVHEELRLAPLADGTALLLVRDVTAARLAEIALHESDAKLRVLADHITDALWIRSPDMQQLRFVSPGFERIWGRPAGELYSQPLRWMDFIVPEDREHVVRTFAGISGGTPALEVQYRILRPDGECRWVRARAFQVRDATGRHICNTGIVTDITEHKLAQAELGEAHRQLIEASRRTGMAEVASNVLHNVGNILNSVTVSASLLRGALSMSRAQGLQQALDLLQAHAGDLPAFLGQDDKGRLLPGYLASIAQALQQEQQAMAKELDHLTASVDHIREVITAQQSHARRGGTVGPAKVGELLDDAVRINAQALERDGVEVLRRLAEVPDVELDRARVLQILVNLVGNAREALRSNPPGQRRLTLETEVRGDRLRIAVRDEGEGIPAENLTRIFAHGFTTRKHGHGFGLHSCRQAATEMGGELSAHSEGSGRGAVFNLDLPLQPAHRS